MVKATKKQALGRGLSALLKDPENDIRSASDRNAEKVVGHIVELELDQISVNPFQPRTNFQQENLQELATSIRELGVIQPITVRKLGFGEYQLISGERRFRAAKLAQIDTIPAYVRLANDQESLEMALVENIQRQDLDPIEIALSYQRLIDEIGITQEKLSDRVGKKRSTIANYLRLLKLDPIIQTGMRDGFLSMGHGRALINVEDRAIQLRLYEKVIEHSLSVRDTEELVRNLKNEPKFLFQKDKVKVPNYITDVLKEWNKERSMRLEVKYDKTGKGQIRIPFSSKEEFFRIKKLLDAWD